MIYFWYGTALTLIMESAVLIAARVWLGRRMHEANYHARNSNKKYHN